MTQEDWVYLSKKMFGDNELTEVRADYLRFQHPWITLGEVWNWATKQEWWEEFITYALNHEADPIDGIKVHDFCAWLVDPTRFPKLVVDFLWEKGEYDGLCI